MAMNQTGVQRGNQNDVGRESTDRNRDRDTNPDAITGAPGSHPVGTGVGTATGGVAGAAAGAAIGSVVPGVGTVVGGVIGAVVGGTGGGLVGKGVAENVNPTAEDAYWRENYKSRPYAANENYEEFAPAYRYGWESRGKYRDRKFEDVESNLARDWDTARSSSHLEWSKARNATRDAWNRVDRPANDDSSAVNDLIETLKDGQNGFETAASNVQDASLKAIFTQFARQRAQFATELQHLVRNSNAEPQQSGSATAALHRGWMNLKNALGGGDQSILNEAERGEDVAVESYEKALASNLPSPAAEVVRRQFLEIKKAHDQVRDLRNSRR